MRLVTGHLTYSLISIMCKGRRVMSARKTSHTSRQYGRRLVLQWLAMVCLARFDLTLTAGALPTGDASQTETEHQEQRTDAERPALAESTPIEHPANTRYTLA